MIYSYELEKQLLAALIKKPENYFEISAFINEKDFFSEDNSLNKTIFTIVRQALEAHEEIDDVIIAQRVQNLGISFDDVVNVAEYVKSLGMRKVADGSLIKTAKELKKYTIRREIYESSQNIAKKMKTLPAESSYSEIISVADKEYNSRINQYEVGNDSPENIYDEMEMMIEDRGANPVSEFGMMGPHEKINSIYGSLLRPGNITVIVARSGVGKTQFCMDYTTRTSAKYNVPVLHFDNGEMSEEELIFRQCSAMTGIPVWLLQTGKWRTSSYKNWSAEEVVDKVRSAWAKIKNMRFYYENVAGMSADEMCSLLKRFYYSKIGRGNPLIFSFDYIKSDFGNMGKGDGWQQVAYMVHKFKQTIHRDLCFDGKPCVSMLTSVQSNRLGITNNRQANAIVDDESVVSLSDGITQFCSHLFLLRRKVAEEIHEEGERFGTHKLVNLKARHLGKDALRAINPVNMPDGSNKSNFINLHIENFKITERGDLQDIVDSMNNSDINVETDDETDDIPMILSQ